MKMKRNNISKKNNYVNISGRIRKIEKDEDDVVVRLKIFNVDNYKDDDDKSFIDCRFSNYNKYKLLDSNQYKIDDFVNIKGSLNKYKHLSINGSHIVKILN